jgi:hypothetical protein
MRQLGIPARAEDIAAIAMTDGCVDYFSFSDALSGLANTGHIAAHPEEGGAEGAVLYALGPQGARDLALYENRVPPSLKKAAASAALKTLARLKTEGLIRCELISKGENHFVERCILLEGKDEVIHLEMMVASLKQADILEQNFKKNAAAIYNRILEAMTADYSKGGGTDEEI